MTRFWKKRCNEFYYLKAQQEKKRTRSFFKIQEISKKFSIPQRGSYVLDIGASPGGWSLHFSGRSKVVAVDILSFAPIANVDMVKGDFFSYNIQLRLIKLGPYDYIFSDLAMNITGVKVTDDVNISFVMHRIIDFIHDNLKKGGGCCIKTFQRPTTGCGIRRLQKIFKQTKVFKPTASLKSSSEIYLVGMVKIS